MSSMKKLPAALLIFLASCSGPEADTKSREPYERYLRVRKLARRPDAESMAEVVRLLDDPHYLVVTGALETLAKIGDPAFLQHAAPKIKHGHPMVRAQACAALAAIRNEEGIPAIREAMKDADASVRRAAVKALAAFGPRPETVRALAEAVGDNDPGVALAAHEALQGLTGRKDVPRAREAWEKAVP